MSARDKQTCVCACGKQPATFNNWLTEKPHNRPINQSPDQKINK